MEIHFMRSVYSVISRYTGKDNIGFYSPKNIAVRSVQSVSVVIII